MKNGFVDYQRDRFQRDWDKGRRQQSHLTKLGSSSDATLHATWAETRSGLVWFR